MPDKIYTFSFAPDWMELTNEISLIDRFDAAWSTIEKREGQSLRQLKSIATVRSVGASTRIEGSKMTDDEVQVLIKDLSISKLEERDQQEVAGYFETLELIGESFREIDISENNLKYLHTRLMKYNEKDAWHRGNYKQHSNVVEAKNPDGSKQVIFEPTQPGFSTNVAMFQLIEWFRSDHQSHPLIKLSIFVYDFLSIHPFQDGNGRLSRLLGTLLLLKSGYSWIQFMSFEHEIESRKIEYYRILMQCQGQRPGEDVFPWVRFFLDCMKNLQKLLMEKLEIQKASTSLSLREKKIYSFIENHPGSKSSEIARGLEIPLSTVKRLLAGMANNKLLVMSGAGAGISYNIEDSGSTKKNVAIRFTNVERRKELTIINQRGFIQIKKFILTPLFDWSHPNEWSERLVKTGLYLQITYLSNNRKQDFPPYPISPGPYHYQPIFILSQPINIPGEFLTNTPYKVEFPIQVTLQFISSAPKFDFDVMVVYDEG